MSVKCPKCHSENPDTQSYCGDCGTQLGPPKDIHAHTKTLETPFPQFSPGTSLAGRYKIISMLGKGGMGEVYLAEDTNLKRQVAIKVLPHQFSQDKERLTRFEREARLLASISHPNIATIYGLERSDDQQFLVMELVEGETLADRIKKGPLPLEEALEVCKQIAEGLESAHEKGIIHRDLKPSNVKVAPDGKVKILDFGLAKAFHDELTTTASDLSKSPTLTDQMTRPGAILGTAAYMSPEQARSRTVDKRTDIWAFGCVLYECLAGKRAFPGDTVTESLAAILRGEPDLGLLPADTPGNVRAVLRRCLQKDPRRRRHDIADVRLDIEEPMVYPSEAKTAPRRFSLAWLATCTAVALLAGILIDRALIKHPQPISSPALVTSTIKVEPGYWLEGMRTDNDLLKERPSRTAMAISSDGRFLVYSAIEANPGAQAKSRLFQRRLDQAEAKPIAGTEGGIRPFLSPDNRWVGFWSTEDGKLKKVSVEGGVPSPLCDTPRLIGADWGRDNSIIFSTPEWGLSTVSAEGGKPETLTMPDRKREDWSHGLPSWLPDGKAVLFTVMRYELDWQPWLCLLRLDTREWRVLLQDAADARYVPTGHLVFLRQGTLMAIRFDLDRQEIVGQPVALVENVMQAMSMDGLCHTGAGQFGISDTGSLIYAPGGIAPDEKNSLVWVDQRGEEQPVTDLQVPFFAPRLSPDGRRIAYTALAQKRQIWVYDLGRGTNSRLTDEGEATFPVWSPDGKQILFRWTKFAAGNLFWQPYDGSSPMERLTTSEYDQVAGSWSPDGKTVAIVENNRDTGFGFDIAILDISSGRVTPFLNSQFTELWPDFSPDGRWIAYTSNESERFEVYVRAFPGPGMKRQVSNEGGVMPLWARDGKQLFYRSWLEGKVWVVDVRTDGSFAAGKPRLLFDKPGYAWGGPARGYDLSLDSQRFLMVKHEPRKSTPVTEMILIQNWFEEIKRLVSTGK